MFSLSVIVLPFVPILRCLRHFHITQVNRVAHLLHLLAFTIISEVDLSTFVGC